MSYDGINRLEGRRYGYGSSGPFTEVLWDVTPIRGEDLSFILRRRQYDNRPADFVWYIGDRGPFTSDDMVSRFPTLMRRDELAD